MRRTPGAPSTLPQTNPTTATSMASNTSRPPVIPDDVLPPPNYSDNYTAPQHLPQHDQTVVEQQISGPDVSGTPPPLYDELYGTINLEDERRRSTISALTGEDTGMGGQAKVTGMFNGRCELEDSVDARCGWARWL